MGSGQSSSFLVLTEFCFHSISFPSEWGVGNKQSFTARLSMPVSIQLVSPTGGEYIPGWHGDGLQTSGQSFHSISFPNEWGVSYCHPRIPALLGFHSISFPNEWGVSYCHPRIPALLGFHSISFPNEWGDEYKKNGQLAPVVIGHPEFPFN